MCVDLQQCISHLELNFATIVLHTDLWKEDTKVEVFPNCPVKPVIIRLPLKIMIS